MTTIPAAPVRTIFADCPESPDKKNMTEAVQTLWYCLGLAVQRDRLTQADYDSACDKLTPILTDVCSQMHAESGAQNAADNRKRDEEIAKLRQQLAEANAPAPVAPAAPGSHA